MSNFRIVFMGTPEFAVPSLKMLIENGYNVLAVVTQPDKPKGRGNKLTASPVKEYSLSKGIEVLQPVKVRTGDFADSLKKLSPNLFITAAYGRILTAEVLKIPKYGCINVHGSLLPKYRGASPIQSSIINGDTITGITTMFTDIGMDTGDILLKSEIEIGINTTAGELHDILAEIGAKTLKETLEKLDNGTLERKLQNESESTHCSMLQKEVGHINWSKTAAEVHNLVRGTDPWPGAYTFYKGQKLRIWKTIPINKSIDIPGAPVFGNVLGQYNKSDSQYNECRFGEIFVFKKDDFYVKAKDGLIKIIELQLESSRKMTSRDFAAGHSLLEGELLE
jgi:methionyl-tRNA formyltransferase